MLTYTNHWFAQNQKQQQNNESRNTTLVAMQLWPMYLFHVPMLCHSQYYILSPTITIMIMKLLSHVYMVFNCIHACHCSVKQFPVGRLQVFFEMTSSIQKHCSSVWTTKMHLLFHTFCYLPCSTILQRGAARTGRNGCLYPRHS